MNMPQHEANPTTGEDTYSPLDPWNKDNLSFWDSELPNPPEWTGELSHHSRPLDSTGNVPVKYGKTKLQKFVSFLTGFNVVVLLMVVAGNIISAVDGQYTNGAFNAVLTILVGVIFTSLPLCALIPMGKWLKKNSDAKIADQFAVSESFVNR